MKKILFEPIEVLRTTGYALLILIALFFQISCGKKEVKPVSPESKLAQEAFALAETLKNAYSEKDMGTLEDNSTRDGYRELIGAIKNFERADLIFTPTWVEIKDSTVRLTISWKGTWTIKNITTEDRGIAIFVLEGSPLKLAKVQRADPFRQPE
jgi:hypothetical protein